jgi:hypothetical protein
LEEGLLPDYEISFIFSHPSAFSTREKDTSYFDFHNPFMQPTKKKEGVGYPTPS